MSNTKTDTKKQKRRPRHLQAMEPPRETTPEQFAAREAEIGRMVRTAPLAHVVVAAAITALRAIDRVRVVPEPWAPPPKEDYPGVEGACLLVGRPDFPHAWVGLNGAVRCAQLLADDSNKRWAAIRARQDSGEVPGCTLRWSREMSEVYGLRALSFAMALVGYNPAGEHRETCLTALADALSISGGLTAVEDLRDLLAASEAAE